MATAVPPQPAELDIHKQEAGLPELGGMSLDSPGPSPGGARPVKREAICDG